MKFIVTFFINHVNKVALRLHGTEYLPKCNPSAQLNSICMCICFDNILKNNCVLNILW